MGYSMNRAVPMAILGFIVGAGFVILLRGLQQMDTLWDPQLGLMVGGVVATIFFIWGIGGMSAQMAAHHVAEPEDDEFGNELPVEDHHHDEETPVTLLGSQVWTVFFWVMVLFAGLFIFAALPGGFGYTLSSDPAANANANGFFPVDMGGGNTLYVSKLLAFILLVAFTMISLFGAAWLFARALTGLNQGITSAKAEGNQPLSPLFATPLAAGVGVAALPSGDGNVAVVSAPVAAPEPAKPAAPPREYNGFFDWAFAALFGTIGWVFGSIGKLVRFHINMLLDEPTPADARSTGERFKRVALLVVLAFPLYIIFYEVAIGLVMPTPYWLRMVISFANVVLVLLLIFRTRWVLFIIGTVARFTARVLRGIPEFLFQRD